MLLLNLNLDFRFLKRRLFTPLSLEKRLKILKNKIRRMDPEIITFQEVPDVFPIFRLKRILKKYAFVYQGSLKISGGVITLYSPKRWQLVKKRFIAFSEQGKFFSKQLADRILRKGILLTVLKNLKTGGNLLLFNVHLTANYGQRLKEEEREILKIQLWQIQKLLKEYKKECPKVIIAGDFNASFASRAIQIWLKKNRLKPAFSLGSCTVCPTKNPLCHRDQKKDFQIDNIVCRDCRKISGKLVFNRKGEFVSDHFGELVKVKLSG